MSSSEAKNLEAICRALDHHDRTCPFPALEIRMNPFEVKRLGWEEIRGIPIVADPGMGTGCFRIICDANQQDEHDVASKMVSTPVIGIAYSKTGGRADRPAVRTTPRRPKRASSIDAEEVVNVLSSPWQPSGCPSSPSRRRRQARRPSPRSSLAVRERGGERKGGVDVHHPPFHGDGGPLAACL